MTIPNDGAAAIGGRLTRLGSVYIVARGVQVAALFVVLPLVTRLLDKEQYGIVVLAQVAHQVVAAIVPLGLTSVVAWSIYERSAAGLDHARQMVLATALTSTALTFVIAATAPVWTGVFADVGNPPAMQIAVWMAIPVTIQSACLSVLQAQGRAREFAVSAIVSSAGGQLLGLLLLWWLRSSWSYMAGVAVGSAAGAVVAAASIPMRITRMPSRARFVGGLRHGGPTVVHLLGFMLLAVGDRVIVERVMGVDAAARYQAAYSLGSLGLAVLFAVNNAWAPAVYEDPDSEDWSVLVESTRWVYGFAALLMAVLALSAPVLLRIAVPPSYVPDELVPVAVVVLASMVPNVTYLAAVHVVFRRRRTGFLFIIVPVAGVANIGLNLVLVPYAGLIGAAMATLIGYVIGGVIAMLAARAVGRVAWDRRTELLWYCFAAVTSVLSAVLVGGGIIIALRCLAALLLVLAGLAAIRRVMQGAGMTGVVQPSGR